MAGQEEATEMSVDFLDQVLVFNIIKEAAFSERMPDGSKLDGDQVQSLYRWLTECRNALTQHAIDYGSKQDGLA